MNYSLIIKKQCGLLAMAVLMGTPASSLAQVGEANPLQYAAIAEGTYMLNSTINSQTKGCRRPLPFREPSQLSSRR